jgi:hypothetical protein
MTSVTVTQTQATVEVVEGSTVSVVPTLNTITVEVSQTGMLPDGNENGDVLSWNSSASSWEPVDVLMLTNEGTY